MKSMGKILGVISMFFFLSSHIQKIRAFFKKFSIESDTTLKQYMLEVEESILNDITRKKGENESFGVIRAYKSVSPFLRYRT